MTRLVFSERSGEYWATCFKVLNWRVSRVILVWRDVLMFGMHTYPQYASVNLHHRSQSHQYELCSSLLLVGRDH